MRAFARSLPAVLAVALVAASGAAASHASKPNVLRLHFVQIGNGVCCTGNPQVAASGRYAFFITYMYRTESSPPGGVTIAGMVGVLRDERTGRQMTLSPPGCSSFGDPLFGGPWLMVDCGGGVYDKPPQPELYNLSSGRWLSVTLAPRIKSDCAQISFGGPGSCTPVGVGARWLKFAERCYHCTTRNVLQSIQTGATKPDPASPGGRVFDDLDSPSAVRPLCAPLRYPRGSAAERIGWLTFYGRFALAAGYPSNQSVYTYTHAYLERCGSKARITLPSNNNVVASERAVVWGPANSSLRGVLLPSSRPVTVPLPKALINAQGTVAGLNQRALYILGGQGQLWAAALPPSP